MKISVIVIFVFIAALSSTYGADPFPKDYEASRARFIKSAQEIQHRYPNALIEAFHVPSATDPDLTVDTLYIPAQERPERLVILTSGVHGAEGFAGSAIQQILLEKYLSSFDLKRNGLLLVHAVNPFGFKQDRRVTENNVNLNRGFDVDPALFTTRNEGYERLREILEPRAPVCSDFIESGEVSAKVIAKLVEGLPEAQINQAIGSGQYFSEKGVEFGGKDFEPQTKYLVALFSRVIPGYPKVLHLDLHTGLGKKKTLHLMTGESMTADARKEMNRVFGNGFSSGSFELTDGSSQGFYADTGDLIDLIPKLKIPHVEVLALTAEFGTVGNSIPDKLITLDRLVLENQGFHYGYASISTEKEVKRNFSELFFPSSEDWRQNFLVKANELLRELVNGT